DAMKAAVRVAHVAKEERMSQTQATNIRMFSLAVITALVLCSTPTLAATEVRWSQWKTTEVGEKFMAEFKAAFEKDNPDITLTLVDSPFTGFHDKAVVLFQAKKLPDVLLVQVDWVAEFADLGMLEPLDDWIAKEPPRSSTTSRRRSTRNGAASSITCRSRAAPSRCSTTRISSRAPACPDHRRRGMNTNPPQRN